MEEKVRVLDRAFDILDVLSETNMPMTLSEIAEACHLSKSTVHRILAAMLARSVVAKSESGEYTIGYKIIEMASTHINNLELLTEAKPYLSKLMRELDLTAHLGILDGPTSSISKKWTATRIHRCTLKSDTDRRGSARRSVNV